MNFASSDLPANIDTVEKLHAWSGLLLQYGNNSLKSREAENYTDFACQASLFSDADGQPRYVSRVNFFLEPDFATNGKKLYLSVKEFSEQSIPASYKP